MNDYDEGFWKSPHQVVLEAVKTQHSHLKSTWSVHPEAFMGLQKFTGSHGMHAFKKSLRKRISKILPMLTDLSKREVVLRERLGGRAFFRDLTAGLDLHSKQRMGVGELVLVPGSLLNGSTDKQTDDPLLSEYAIKRAELLKELAALMDEFQTFWETYYH